MFMSIDFSHSCYLRYTTKFFRFNRISAHAEFEGAVGTSPSQPPTPQLSGLLRNLPMGDFFDSAAPEEEYYDGKFFKGKDNKKSLGTHTYSYVPRLQRLKWSG